jgi:hypothetical protein
VPGAARAVEAGYRSVAEGWSWPELPAGGLIKRERDATRAHAEVRHLVERQRRPIGAGAVEHQDAGRRRVLKIVVFAVPCREVPREGGFGGVKGREHKVAGVRGRKPTGPGADTAGQESDVENAIDGGRYRARIPGTGVRAGKALGGIVECLRDADCPAPAANALEAGNSSKPATARQASARLSMVIKLLMVCLLRLAKVADRKSPKVRLCVISG